MRTPRLAGIGLGLIATATFGVAGCGDGGKPATPASQPAGSTPPSSSPASTGPTPTTSDSAGSGPVSTGPADPAATAALAAAAAQLGTTSFKITMTAGTGLSLNGLVDAPHGVGSANLALTGNGTSLKVDTLLVGQDLYVRLPGNTQTTGGWTHLDVSRLPEGANVGLRPGRIDPANTARLLTTSTDVQPAGTGHYRGTLDLTKAAGIPGIDQVNIDGWGGAAQRVPFTAALDAQGRLDTMILDLPPVAGQPAQPLQIHYTEYGTTVVVSKPAGVTEAPESLYTALNG